MKKSFKKLACLGLAVTLAATMFAACGSKEDEGTKSDATKFYIGGTGPLTGGAAIYGNAVKNAAEIAVEEINAAGGINGYQIEFKFVDDEHDAEKAVSGYNVLKDWGMQIMMGTVTSGPCTAVADKTNIDGISSLHLQVHQQNVLPTITYSRYVSQTLTRVQLQLHISQKMKLQQRLQ